MSKLKVIVLTASVSRNAGGLLCAVSTLCKKNKSDLSVFGLKDKNTSKDKHHWGDVFVKSFKINGFSFFGFSKKLTNAVLNCKSKILHLHGIWMYPQFLALKWQDKYKRPVIISPHGMLDPWALNNSSWKKKIVGFLFANKSLRKANCIHALCNSEYESIRSYGLTNPVAIIPNGIDLPKDFKKKIQNKSKKNLLFIGRIHPKKGLKLLIEAIHILKSNNESFVKKWQLHIVGWNQQGHEDELKVLCNNYNLESEIKFLGPLFDDKKVEALKKADAFILPSYSEGLPMSVLEAWSYQLPVLMTKECNLYEGFDNNAAIEIGLSPNQIADKLIFLNKMSLIEYKDMSNNALKLVKQKFTWDIIASDMEKTYNWLTTQKEKPDFIKLR
jgi:poly(glycerol-phosphate) alpha-glucosyltransferase